MVSPIAADHSNPRRDVDCSDDRLVAAAAAEGSLNSGTSPR
jgi:hypothetical protein